MNNRNFYFKQRNKTKLDVFDIIINHLLEATGDLRHRERLRARIALRKIKDWIELSNRELKWKQKEIRN